MRFLIFAIAFLISGAALADGFLKDSIEQLNQNNSAPDTGDFGIYFDLIDNVGFACAGANNYQVNYRLHLAD